jgi:cell division protein FtsI (penicillin-binding protein 3)
MNKNKNNILIIFIFYIKKIGIDSLKGVLYFLMYARLCSLKFKHFILFKSKRLPGKISSYSEGVNYSKYYKSLFAWDLRDSVTHTRVNIVLAGFAIVFLIISVRLIVVASSDYINYRHSDKNVRANRYDIVDRYNNLLAVNLPGASLYANPRRVIDPIQSIKKLQSVFPDLDRKQLLDKLMGNKSFEWIKRDVTPQEHEKIYNLGMPGFGFEREQKRIYTYGNLLSNVIGYVGRDLNGLAGIEKYFDKYLAGNEPLDGDNHQFNSLQLSIDVRVQNILSEEIDATMKKFSAKGGAGLVVDPNNGEIIALVSKPDFNPHHPGKAKPEQLFNMATQGAYEMGSGIKSLTMAIGLDSGATSLKDAYDLTYMKVSGFKLNDYPRQIKGWRSVPFIFLKSSNIGIAQIMLEIGKSDLLDYLKKLGLLDRLKIELPERARPLFPAYSRWTDLSLITMSYGYGMSESPAHFVQAMVPIMNGGMLYPLTLVKINPTQPLVGKRVIKESTSDDMRKLMRLVVSKGTGSKAEVEGYYVGGKTGTANIAHAGKYDKTRRVSSFIGVIPASYPKYMVYIIYNEPKGIKETLGYAGGGWVAAPSVGVVFKKLAALYGLEKPDENSPEVQELKNVEYEIHDEA